MFWKKKPKLPITPEDQIWVEESLTFLKESFGKERLLVVKTAEPTKEFFNRDFDHSEADAEFVLSRCLELMDIAKDKVELEFYSEENHYLEDGTLLSTSADIHGRSQGAAGTYQKKGAKAIIRIERGLLKHTESLIATISHELAHEKLLGEGRIMENDEYLTDLTAIVFGFGIFIANAKFQFASGLQNGFGWQMQSQGYLAEQVTAYAIASLSLKKREAEQQYAKHLDPSVAKYVEQSLGYLKSEENKDKAVSFWPIGIASLAEEMLERTTEKKLVEQGEFTKEALEKLQQELSFACLRVDLTEVENILQQGVSPNCIYVNGSPLAIAVLRNSIDLFDLLLQYGADINFSEPENILDKSPLMIACEKENSAMMKYLIDLGAEINLVGGNGKSILEIAVATGNTKLVGLLLDSGANTEIKSGYSYTTFDKTPICAAVMNNDPEMVSFLVNQGAKTKPIRKLDRHEIHPKMVKFLKARKYL